MGFVENTERRFAEIKKKQTLLRRMLLFQIMFCVLIFFQIHHLHNQ